MKAEADGRGQREMHMSQAHAPTRGGFDCRRAPNPRSPTYADFAFGGVAWRHSLFAGYSFILHETRSFRRLSPPSQPEFSGLNELDTLEETLCPESHR